MKTLLKSILIASLFSPAAFAVDQIQYTTSAYYCQVNIPGARADQYLDVEYKMTKAKIGSVRNYAVEVTSAKYNTLGLEYSAYTWPVLEDGKYIKLGLINELTNDTSIGSIHFGIRQNLLNSGSAVKVELDFLSLDYSVVYNVRALLNGHESIARCQKTASTNHL
ncbi:MAG: hypothetical protein M9962_12285 [Oligoflexia bacterium]|nr:hypothetical protein [Oligoflexia bacterium]